MINPNELLDAFVEKLREIPELVAAMQGDPERIYTYKDSYPEQSSLPVAVHEMPSPGIMAVWAVVGPTGFSVGEVWLHQLHLYVRAQDYGLVFRLLTKGVPASTGIPLIGSTVHDNFYPMDPPSIERQADIEGLDYCLVTVPFKEIGDE